MIHTLITVAITTVAWFFGWHQAAAVITAALYIGREHAQAEYRTIYKNYGNRRDIAPWWCGFELRAWNTKSLLDWIGPLIITVITLVI